MIKDQDPKKNEVKVPRTFASQAYLRELDKGIFGLYRDVLVEDEKTGQREKAGKIGPISLLRPAKEGENVVLRTVHPQTQELLELTEVEDPATGR
jgi:hypothetical protein